MTGLPERGTCIAGFVPNRNGVARLPEKTVPILRKYGAAFVEYIHPYGISGTLCGFCSLKQRKYPNLLLRSRTRGDNSDDNAAIRVWRN